MTFQVPGFGHAQINQSSQGQGDGHTYAGATMTSDFPCNAVYSDCSFLSYCPMESNHYESHRCSQGHSY
jgi:hypothetical protein